MSGHRVDQWVSLLMVSGGQSSGIGRALLITRGSDEEATSNLKQNVVRIQFFPMLPTWSPPPLSQQEQVEIF